MALLKIKDFDPDYRDHFDNDDIIGYSLYSGNEKVGSVDDLLVDEAGNFRYFVINTGLWILGKKVLLPIGQARIDQSDRRVYVNGLTKEQVEHLPSLDDREIDYDYEEEVRGTYRPMAASTGTSAATGTSAVAGMATGASAFDPTYDREAYDYTADSYSYDRDPDLYGMNDTNHKNLRLYEERLIANKNRVKTGEVSVGKHVVSDTQRVSVPVEKERVVVERVPYSGGATGVTPGADAFNESEVARVEVYEETPDIHKEAFVREEVSVRKEVDRETVNAEETVRREELDLDKQGNPVINTRPDQRI